MGRPFYVTTPIYYVNDVPHIGHAYSTLAADVLARWRRLWGDEVVFLTGTDEHGLKVQQAAEEHEVAAQEWADRTSSRFCDAWALLDISNTDFIRTTEPRHHAAVRTFLQQVYDNGYIELGTYEGIYCVACEAYYTEDELDENGMCPIHHRPIEHVTEENYFFQLSRFEQPLLDYYEHHPDAVQPPGKRNEVLGFIRQGLRDFSMSRTSISWGIPIPWDPGHVTYVWFEALVNYLTGVGYGSDDARFARFWPADYHIIGKDILRFHAVYWPAMLMAAGIDLPKHVFAHGFLQIGGEKMSKTGNNMITPADLISEFGVDGFRYHFMVDQRFGPDGEFSYEAMVARYNADLANNFGNLASRVLNMAGSYLDGATPRDRSDGPLREATERAVADLTESMDRLDYSSGFGAVWKLIKDVNSFIEDCQPWATHKAGDLTRTAEVLGDCLESLRIIALLASPVIPEAAGELWSRLGLDGTPEDQRLPDAAGWGAMATAGNRLEKGAALPAARSELMPDKPGAAAPCEPSDARSEYGSGWSDSHCHLPADPFDADAQLDRARAAGVERFVCVGTDLQTSRLAVSLAGRHDDVVATVGLHPHDASELGEQWEELSELAAGPGVVAVGECGFDLHYNHSSFVEQEAAFAAQVRLANDLDHTLVVHTREAWDDTFRVLADNNVPRRVVFHCFTGGPSEAERALAIGAYLSFSGIVTFKNAEDVRAAAVATPDNRVLVETDAPYLAPVPYRGSVNEPMLVGAVGAALARATGRALDAVRNATRATTERVLGG